MTITLNIGEDENQKRVRVEFRWTRPLESVGDIIIEDMCELRDGDEHDADSFDVLN